MQLIRCGGDNGIAEQLLRQAAHGIRSFPDHGKVASGFFRLRLLLQEVKIPADSGQRRAQVVGYIRDGGCQLVISGLQL